VLALAACGAPSDPSTVVAPEVSTSAVASGGQRLLAPKIDWAPCGDEFPGTECGVAEVPLDYDRPFGKMTFIALARVPASDPKNRVGAVFVNPGGPGGSGVEMVLGGFGVTLANLLGGRFDVVGFDPRGVGRSDPIQCFDTMDDRDAYFAPLPVFPYRRDQERPFFDQMRSLSGVCLGRDQPITSHMSTADVVRDLDLLRQAVGDERLTFLGFSYGSYIGNTYANMFPGKVRALVIDGVLDPRLWSSGWQVTSDRVATAREFEEFLRLCDEAGPDCALGAPGGSGKRFEALAQALLKAPLVFPDGFAYSYDFLVANAASAMYAPEFWGGPDGYGAFFGSLADAVLGAPTALERAAEIRGAILARLDAASPKRLVYDNFLDAYYGNQCADTQYPSFFPAFTVIGAWAREGSFFGPYWWWGNAGCANWPVSPDRYAGPWVTRTSAPVLVVGNLFDGVTEYAGAVASSRLLQNSRLLTYAGWGHTAFLRSECVTGHVLAYLSDGTLPLKGTVCPANPNPFLPAPVMLRAAAREPMVGLPPAWPKR
jgi:pimeloyl-ACP methyl ester carboxylesterase